MQKTKLQPRNKANLRNRKDVPFQPVRSMLFGDKDARAALDCLYYLNVFVKTSILPVDSFILPHDLLNNAPIAQRTAIPARFSDLLPKVSRYAFIVQVRSIQAHKNGIEPISYLHLNTETTVFNTMFYYLIMFLTVLCLNNFNINKYTKRQVINYYVEPKKLKLFMYIIDYN